MSNILRTVPFTVVLAAGIAGIAGPKPGPMKLTMQMVGEEHCQFTASIQAETLRVRLRFVNVSRDILTVQDSGSPSEIRVAKTAGEMKKGVYEVQTELEQFEPSPVRKIPLPIKPGDSFETDQLITVTVKQDGPPSDLQVGAGTHYLQVGNAVSLGADDPFAWRRVSARSVPIAIKVEYSPNASPCSRKEPDSIEGVPPKQ